MAIQPADWGAVRPGLVDEAEVASGGALCLVAGCAREVIGSAFACLSDRPRLVAAHGESGPRTTSPSHRGGDLRPREHALADGARHASLRGSPATAPDARRLGAARNGYRQPRIARMDARALASGRL